MENITIENLYCLLYTSKLVTFSGEPQRLGLPSAPKQFIQYLEEDNRPQVALDVDFENGMGISCLLYTSKGSTYMKSAAGVDAEIASVITGIILFFSACNCLLYTSRPLRQRRAEETGDSFRHR